MDDIEVPSDLFKGLKFCLLDDDDVSDKVKGLLLSGGGTHNSYLSDMVTHVICDNPDNPDVSEAQELFEKPVVKSRWVITSIKCKALLPLSGFFATKNQLFFGLTFSATQVLSEDKKKLWGMITFFGGTFHRNFTKSCSHLIVGKAEGTKYDKALVTSIKVVTPDWVTDSIENKCLCDEDLYHPRLLILPQPEIPDVPSPASPLTSTLISLDKINIDPGLSAATHSEQMFFQNIKLTNLDNKIAEDILSNLPNVDNIKLEPNIQQYAADPSFLTNRMESLSAPVHQMNISARPQTSPSPQNLYQQSLQHQQMLQQGEQKLSQALQQIQAQQLQQQQLLQQRPQLQSQQAQLLQQQQKAQWTQQQQQQQQSPQQQQQLPQQRMAFTPQQIIQMQRLRALQQQQLRNRQGLPPAQLTQLQQLQQQQQQSIQSQQQQQAQLPRQQSPAAALLQKQVQVSVQQIPQQQGQVLMQPGNQNQRAQMNAQLQAQLRQQQQQLSQMQQQALQKHQLQQLQLLKQQHLQLQQQQQQQVQLNQQRALSQSPNMPPSPLHIQQQNILQGTPRQSPLQQPAQQTSLQAQQIALEKAQQSALDKQQTELIKVQLKQAALERVHIQAVEKARIQQTLEKSALEKAQQQQSGFENSQIQQTLLQHPQLQRSAAQQLHLQQQLHQIQLQKASLQQVAQQSSGKIEMQQNIQTSQIPHSQFSVQQTQLQSVNKPTQFQGSMQQIQQQNPSHRFQLQQLSVQQLQQRLLMQQNAQQRMPTQASQGQLHALQQQLQLQQLSQGNVNQQAHLGNNQVLQQGSPVQQQPGSQLRIQQGSPQSSPANQSLQLQGSPHQLPQGSPAQHLQIPQGSPAQQHLSLSQGSPAQHMQLSQGSPAQHLQLPQGSPAQHLQLPQGSPASLGQMSQVSVPQSISAQSQVSTQQASPQQGQIQASPQQIQPDSTQQSTTMSAQSPQDVLSQPQVQTALQSANKLTPQQNQLPQVSSPLHQFPQSSSQNQIPQSSPQTPDLQQNQSHLQTQVQQIVTSEINPPTTPSPLRQTPPIQMQLQSPQSQLQKAQLQRAQQIQLPISTAQQVLLKQVASQSQLQQGISNLQQSGNQQVQLSQASVQQVHLHVLQQARLQALRQQQAQLQQSITQGPSLQSNQINSSQQGALQQAQVLSSPQENQVQTNAGQSVRQALQSPQNLQGQLPQPSQTPRLQSPLQQAQLQQQLSQLQHAQLQKSPVSQAILQQNQVQAQLQQIHLRHSALQQARLQQSGSAQHLLTQGNIPRQLPPQQQGQPQGQIVAKQIQLQQQTATQTVQQPPQTPPSPQLQQQQVHFANQLSPALRAVQKQFPANAQAQPQQPMHGQPPVQNIHQQQLLQQRQLQQQQQILQQLRQRQQLQQLQNAQHPPQQGVNQQILTGQQPVMIKPPPQYPYDRQQLQGQPRLQYPPQPRQLSPQQQTAPGPRAGWPAAAGQQTQFLRRSPGVNPPPSPQWQHVQQPSPKEELTPSPQPAQAQQQIIWSQRQLPADGTTSPAVQSATQQVLWQQNTAQQQIVQQRDPNQVLQQSQTLQWQQLKQLELRRQQLLQQQQQQQVVAVQQRPPSQSQFSPQSDPMSSPRMTAPSPQNQTLAVPAQYQPQNAPSILTQTSPGAIIHGAQPPTQVTPKTKTALANLLNTRLQTTVVRPGDECNQAVVRTTHVVPQSPQVVARRPSAETIAVLHPQAQLHERAILTPLPPQVVYYGHDPKLNVPGDLCLLGCVFSVQGYDDKSEDTNIEIWTKVITKYGGEIETSYNSRCTHVICESQKNPIVQQALKEGKRCVSAYWLNDVLEKKKLKYPWFAHHLPTPFSDDKPCKSQIISVTNFEADERKVLKNIIHILGAKYTAYMTSHNTVIICKKNEGKKAKKAREWKTPLVNVQWLHDLMFGHMDALRLSMAHKYQNYDLDNPFAIDYAVIPHLMNAWKVPIKINEEFMKKYNIQESFSKHAESALIEEKECKKRKDENDENIEPDSKRLRVESPPLEENIPLTTQSPPDSQNRPTVLFTGIEKIKDLAKIVCQLGGCLAKSDTDCTHLIANQYVRTVKFLCAIHKAKYVITTEWLIECEKQNKFVDEKDYILRDTENEKLFSFKMENVLRRENRAPIFENYVFYVTPGVFPKPDMLKRIIEAGGGAAVFKKAPSLRQISNMEETEKKFVMITCDNDLHLCQMYLENEIKVQNVEFILTNTIRQELDLDSFVYKP